jgi:hypothetical protein
LTGNHSTQLAFTNNVCFIHKETEHPNSNTTVHANAWSLHFYIPDLTMASEPNVRIIVDGDSTKIYRRGDKVTGRVMLVTEAGQRIESLTLSFMGAITTRTTRPFYVSGKDADAPLSRRSYEDRVSLFKFEKELLSNCKVASTKNSWTFDFKFPDLASTKYSRWQHRRKYCRDPHPLPPSFQISTVPPNGQAMVRKFRVETEDHSRERAYDNVPLHYDSVG